MPGLIEARARKERDEARRRGSLVDDSMDETEDDMSNFDRLLDEEDWALLNELTEEELQQLSAEFDPSHVDPEAERQPMFCQEDLLVQLEKAIELASEVDTIHNEKMRQKEEERKRKIEEDNIKKEIFIKKTYSQIKEEDAYDPILDLGEMPGDNKKYEDLLDDDERELLDECTEEELVEIAAILKMNNILTSDQFSAVEAGEKPVGTITKSWSVKAAIQPPCVTEVDEETDLDVISLSKCLKADSDELFYLCINNQPKLEKKILHEVFKRVGLSPKIKHLSLALAGINDDDAKLLARHLRYNENLETINLESNIINIKGMDPLMKSIGKHPNLREVKVSNQKNALGGQGEEGMAKAIEQNENILKFGYSFMNPGARNKADRAILKHNERIRQVKKQGGEVYDLKAECKRRDAHKCPWIVLKTRRTLDGLIKESVNTMGNMEGAEEVSEVRQVARSAGGGGGGGMPTTNGAAPAAGAPPPVRQAKQLDINALLAARKKKLAGGGGGVAELEAAQEEKNKQQLSDMQNKKVDAAPPPMGGMMGADLKKSLQAGAKEMQKKTTQRMSDEEKGSAESAPEAPKEEAAEKSAAEKPKIVIPPVQPGHSAPARRRRKVSVEEEEADPFANLPQSAPKPAEEEKPAPAAEPEVAKPAAIVMPELDSQAPARRRPRKQPSEEEEVDIFASVPQSAPKETEASPFRARITR